MSNPPSRAPKAPSPHDEQADDGIGREASSMSAAETARYIAEFAAELSYLARRCKLDLLAYLLDMAKLEAGRAIQAEKRGS